MIANQVRENLQKEKLAKIRSFIIYVYNKIYKNIYIFLLSHLSFALPFQACHVQGYPNSGRDNWMVSFYLGASSSGTDEQKE